MSKPVIGITGANGFIGSSLAQYFRANAYPVVEFRRSISELPVAHDVRKFDLREDIGKTSFRNVHVLIHTAHMFDSRMIDQDVNFSGTKRLVNAARKDGISKFIFISTVSAHASALSTYATSKFRSHTLFDFNTDAILQCGLALGAGGLFGRLTDYVRRKTFVPIIDGGKQIMQVIAIDDLLRFVKLVVEQQVYGLHVVANNEQLQYRDLFRGIAEAHGKRIIFLPLPSALLKGMLRFSMAAGINMPVSEENLLGLQRLIYMEPSPLLSALSPLMTLRDKLLEMERSGDKIAKVK